MRALLAVNFTLRVQITTTAPPQTDPPKITNAAAAEETVSPVRDCGAHLSKRPVFEP